jgi:N-alpha-acetyl-L-2,4-diaminobutyrate deacetylase
MTRANPIVATVDFDQDGVQHGHLRLPHSGDESAWGHVMIPIAVIKRGAGPTALLTGGNHGDEYEGPLALFELARALRPEAIAGRVIILPAMNAPAFRAGTRTSPIDRANLNRVFPGRPDGSVTEKIADYFVRTLLPLADHVLDFHSGGKTLDFVPFAAAHMLDDKTQEARCVAAMAAFNAPYSMMLRELDITGMYDAAAEGMGKVFISTELGGGGTATARSTAIARKGVRNVLINAGIMDGALEQAPSVQLDMPSADCFTIAEQAGMVEPCVDLGEPVRAGQVLARIWPIERTGLAPEPYRARLDGLLVGRHFPGLIRSGDCLAVIGCEAA